MKQTTGYLKPQMLPFLTYWGLLIIPFFGFHVYINFFLHGSLLPEANQLFFWNVILLPAGLAFGLTLGTRRFCLHIAGNMNLLSVHQQVIHYLSTRGFKIRSPQYTLEIYASEKIYQRIFRNWFGTELTLVQIHQGSLQTIGPYRIVGDMETYLKMNSTV